LVRDAFAMNERRGWRRDLAKQLHLPRSNLTRLLHAPKLPNYANYLGVVGFLELHGVRIVVCLVRIAENPISGADGISPLG
jgi:hypothetical protein